MMYVMYLCAFLPSNLQHLLYRLLLQQNNCNNSWQKLKEEFSHTVLHGRHLNKAEKPNVINKNPPQLIRPPSKPPTPRPIVPDVQVKNNKALPMPVKFVAGAEQAKVAPIKDNKNIKERASPGPYIEQQKQRLAIDLKKKQQELLEKQKV